VFRALLWLLLILPLHTGFAAADTRLVGRGSGRHLRPGVTFFAEHHTPFSMSPPFAAARVWAVRLLSGQTGLWSFSVQPGSVQRGWRAYARHDGGWKFNLCSG
jgi:hypothetical protein